MKKLFAMLLVLALMLMPFAGGEQENDRFYEEMGNYLHYVDRLIEDQLWAIRYTETFLENRTFDNLIIARTAVQAAMREIERMEVPVSVLTADEFDFYADLGVEVEAVEIAYENAGNMKRDALRFLMNLFESLLSDIYFLPLLETFTDELALEKLLLEAEARDTAYFAAYMLAQLQNGEDFWAYMRENLPVISVQMPESIASPEQILVLSDENLLRMEAWINELDVMSGYDDYWLDVFEEALETGDFSKIDEKCTQIENRGVMMPTDDWMSAYTADYWYVYSDEQGDMFFHPMGTEVTSVPNRVMIVAEGVSQNEILEYVETLGYAGCSIAYDIYEEDGMTKLFVIAEKDGEKLYLVWNELECVAYLMEPFADLLPSMYIP